MDLETLYRKVRKEYEPLPDCSPYTALRDAYDSLVGYDLKKADTLLQDITKNDMNSESLLQLDTLIAEGVQIKKKFESLLPKFKIPTENGKLLSRCIEDKINSYKKILEERIIREYMFFESEKEKLKFFCDNGSNNLVHSSRINLDKIAKVCEFLGKLCEKNDVVINDPSKDNVAKYINLTKKVENLKKIITHLSDMRAEIKWDNDQFILIKKAYKDYMEQLSGACEEAEYYEGAVEARSLEQDFRELISNWGYLSEKNKRLNKDITELTDVLNILQNKEADINFFKDLAQKKFTAQAWYEDLRKYAPGAVASYIKFLGMYESLRKSRAIELAKKLCEAGDAKAVLESQNLGELECAKSRAESLAKDVSLLSQFTDISQYKNFLENNARAVAARIIEIQKDNERKHELSKKKIESDEKLRREEISRKYDFEKQAEEFRKKEEAYEKKLQENERESISLASSLKKEKEDGKARERTIDALIENIGKTVQIGKESMEELGKELGDGLYKKICEQLKRELSRVEESISRYGGNTNALAGRINAFQSDLMAIQKELAEIRKEKGQDVSRQKNSSNLENDALNGIYKKLEEIVEIVSKQAERQPSTVMHIGTYINNLTIVEQVAEQKEENMFDFIHALKSMRTPKNMNLNRVRDRILSNTKMNLPDKLLSLREFFGPDWATIQDSDDLDWLKDFRDSLIDEINFGVTGYRIRKGGFIRTQFNDIINCVINPYIARCEQALGTACIN